MELIASWIALEDVQPGSGELMYVPGSHRCEEFLFSNKYKHFSPDRDPKGSLKLHREHCEEQIRRHGASFETFLPKKGDMLFWHADLYHGGSNVIDEGLTRNGLVGHYCPSNAEPNFSNLQIVTHTVGSTSKHHSSEYY